MGEFRKKLLVYLNDMIMMLFYFVGIFIIISLISIGWNVAWTILISDKIWKIISNSEWFRIYVIIVIGCCALALICIAIIVHVIFYIGTNFVPHFICALLFCISVAAELVFIVFLLLNSHKSKRKDYQTKFINLIKQDDPPKAISEWMTKHNCNSDSTCEKSVKSYIMVRVEIGFWADLAIGAVVVGLILAVCITVQCMACIQTNKDNPVTPNNCPPLPSDNNDEISSDNANNLQSEAI